jgi:MFS family permease
MNKSALATVFLVVVIDLLGFGIILPLLPFYAQEFAASAVMIGLLYSVYSFMQLIFSPIWGSWSDRIGRRPIMLLSTFGAVIAYIIFGLAESLGVLFFSRVIAGMMGGKHLNGAGLHRRCDRQRQPCTRDGADRSRFRNRLCDWPGNGHRPHTPHIS